MGYRESVGTNVLPWSWRNFQKPCLFPLWSVLPWGGGMWLIQSSLGGDLVSHIHGVQSLNKEQGVDG